VGTCVGGGVWCALWPGGQADRRRGGEESAQCKGDPAQPQRGGGGAGRVYVLLIGREMWNEHLLLILIKHINSR